MRRYSNRNMNLPEQRALAKLLPPILRQHGFRLSRVMQDGQGNRVEVFTGETPYGELEICLYPDWIPSRFKEASRATGITHSPTGKWNFFAWDVSPRAKDKPTAKEFAAFYEQQLSRLFASEVKHGTQGQRKMGAAGG